MRLPGSPPATINSRSVIHGVAHVLRLGVPSRELPTGADSRCSSADAIGSSRWKPYIINECEALRYAESVRISVEHVWRLAARLQRTA